VSRGLLRAAAFALAAAPPLLAAEASPTATPTPRPRLSGGFGRAEVTPISPGATGQTLEDVVRAASESRRRRETPRPAVTITNQSLVTDPNRGKLTLSQATPRAAAGARTPQRTPTAALAPGIAGGPPTSAEEPAGEEQWRETARQARRRVEDGRTRLTQLEAEAKKLENDFYSWDDGQYRDNVIKPAWDRKKDEVEAARRELAQAEADLADLPERARKAGALPGWIRE
jgi:hypothetical protein